MQALGLAPRPVPEHEPLTEQQRARREAELRDWARRESAVRRVATLQRHDGE